MWGPRLSQGLLSKPTFSRKEPPSLSIWLQSLLIYTCAPPKTPPACDSQPSLTARCAQADAVSVPPRALGTRCKSTGRSHRGSGRAPSDSTLAAAAAAPGSPTGQQKQGPALCRARLTLLGHHVFKADSLTGSFIHASQRLQLSEDEGVSLGPRGPASLPWGSRTTDELAEESQPSQQPCLLKRDLHWRNTHCSATYFKCCRATGCMKYPCGGGSWRLRQPSYVCENHMQSL